MHVRKSEAIVVVNVLALLTEAICKQLNDANFLSVLSGALKRQSVNANNGISAKSWNEAKGFGSSFQ